MQVAPWPGAADEIPGGEPDEEKADILIVDDLPEKLLVFQTVLEELGQNLVKVRSGAAALREILKREFAVILLDVNMPDIDGFETAAMIRKHPRSMMTPIIFITAYADEVQTAKGYSLGAVDYILSPVDPEILRSKVSVFVSLYLMSRQIRRQADSRAAVLAAEAARRVAEENDRRSAFLAQASRELSGSLEAEVALCKCAELLVPEIAPMAVVHLSDPDFGPLGACVAEAVEQAPTRTSRIPESDLDPRVRLTLKRASVSRQRIFDERAQEPGPGSGSPAPSATRSMLAVPLLVGERVLGAILVAAPDGKHWKAPATLLLDEVVARATTAFENVRLYRVLQQEVRERIAAQEELQEADRRKDEFLAMMSHELRNPLSSVKLALEVIRRHAQPHAKVQWGLDVADRQLQHLMRLIEELLDVTRISRGKIVLKQERVDLDQVLAQSVETVRGPIEGRRQVLSVRKPAVAVRIHGDAARLTQIFANLLHNASKYSPEGSAIDLSVVLDGAGVLVQVDDHGIGIDAELLPRVFDMFAQGQTGLDRSHGGLGVGLTLARLLTELHGGRIDVFSEGQGKGACFSVWLPRAHDGEALAAPSSPVHEGAGEAVPGSILVVDDNLDAAEALAAILRIEGHAVRVAQDGEQALVELVDFRPAVVILDIGLPRIDGYAVARRMRQMPEGESVLLIALTGYGQQADRLQAHDAGFDKHFVKPAETRQLLACINSRDARPAAPAGAGQAPS